MDRITLSKSINEQINSLTSSERDSLLFRYMLNERMAEVDEPCCKVEMVRNDNVNGRGVRGKYDIVIGAKDGSNKVVNFGSRLEKLFYVLAIEHADGYRRDELYSKYRNDLFNLWDKLFNYSNEQLIELLDASDSEHKVSNAVARSRKAVEKAIAQTDRSSWYMLTNDNGVMSIPAMKEAIRFMDL